MPVITRLVGLLLVVLGIGSYLGTGQTSVTALIPAFFGVLFILLAIAARREAARKHAMHAAVALGLVGLLATLSRLLPALAAGNLLRPAVLSQAAMALLLIFYVGRGVRSGIEARRARG
jgi:uncharacterized membrane protein